MKIPRMNLVISLGILVALALACGFDTANISSVKMGKDKSVSAESSTFAPDDTVYAVAVISNTSAKWKVKGRVLAEDTGAPVSGMEATVDLPGSGTATFNFKGLAAGKYKFEVTLVGDEDGKQQDQKSVSFTVS